MDWDLYLAVASIGLVSLRPYPVGAFRQRDEEASAKRVRREVSHVRKATECQGPLGPMDRNSGLPHAQAGCGIVQSGAASQVVPRLRSGGSAGSRAETSASCSIVATAYQGTKGGFDGKKPR
jgi:hypothetical protein